MRLSIICCPFKTSYGAYVNSLRTEIEKKTGSKMQWVASNCGCGDAVEVSRSFQTKDVDYFDMPIIRGYQSKTAWKRRVRGAARSFGLYFRAKRYTKLASNAEVVHFQQILNAYGSKTVFYWLNQPSNAARVVTVHELDAEQLEFPERNKMYDRADGIIVHCEEMKKHMVALNVPAEKIHVVLHGTDVPTAANETKREGIIFYAGHKVMTGKGIQTLFKAMHILQEKMGAAAPVLKIHGHYGETTPEPAAQLAAESGLGNKIVWLNQISVEDIVRNYQSSLLCVLPYTGSFAGLPASIAAANQLPVVCTKKAGLPDHLGDCGVWVEEENPQQLADRMLELLSNETLRKETGAKLLKRAESALRWDVIADRTLEVYAQAAKNKAASNGR